MDETLLKQLSPYQTDHLVLLVGTNPLPNYVAAQLLLRPGGKVHLLCSSGTQEIANRLANELKALTLNCRVQPHIDEGLPAEIYARTERLIDGLDSKLSVGLNYTGGTKAMSVHAYRATQAIHENKARMVVFSYLDPRKMALVIDGALDGRDAEIPVANALSTSVATIAGLHGVEFAKPSARLNDNVVDELRRLHQDGAWRAWTRRCLYRADRRDKLKSSTDLREIRPPASRFPSLNDVFSQLGAPKIDPTIEDWTVACGFQNNSDGMTDFAKQITGGYWLEAVVERVLQSIKSETRLFDIAMNLKRKVDTFEFDVAATQGYRLYGISCTTDPSDGLCKSKLMEAYIRARQLGGDEARVALVCGSEYPDRVYSGFKSSNYVAEDAVKVIGKQGWDTLAANLKEWMTR